MLRPIIVLAFLVLIPTTALGTTYQVQPDGTGDFPTIQAAIDEADPGDIIELANGTFTGDGNRDIDYLGKAITVRSQSDSPNVCIIDCQGSVNEPHRGFHLHGGEDENSVLQGVTITNGYAVDHGGGILLESTVLTPDAGATIHNCRLTSNEAPDGAGLAMVTDYESGDRILRMTNCVVYDNQGDGVFISGLYTSFDPFAIISGCNIYDNRASGISIYAWIESGRIRIEQCDISNNDDNGILASYEIVVNIIDCTLSGNGGDGLYGWGEAISGNIHNCTMSQNDSSGISIVYFLGTIQDCVVTDNGGAGIQLGASNVGILGCEIGNNTGSGLQIGSDWREHIIPRTDYQSSVTNCNIWQNGGEGISISSEVFSVNISFSTITGNLADGIRNSGEEIMGDEEFTLSNCTVAFNIGNALIYDSVIPGTLYNTLLAFNQGQAIQCLSGVPPEIACSDLFANTLGDWVDCVENQSAVHGNFTGDPLFCNPDEGNFSLTWDSPCTPENNPDCGLIGAMPVGCNAQGPNITVFDFPNDQGGWVIVSWPAFEQDAPGAENPIISYAVQRLEEETWTTLTELPAVQLPSYTVEIETDDIYVVGEPEPISNYQVLGYTAIPEGTYESQIAGGYSIDNIAPPVPELTLWDGIDFRVLLWENPAIEDFSEVCVFRGTEPGFEPDTPVTCTTEEIYNEDDLNLYCYVIAAFDIHGNASGYSNEACGTYPTNVDDILRQLTLEQNWPNPFNPKTTISYELPSAEYVDLRIFDSRGRLVRHLLSQVQQPGHHSAEWDGADNLGQLVASGTYICRLEAGGYLESKRMMLVR